MVNIPSHLRQRQVRFRDEYKAGILAAGGTKPLFRQATNCLRTSLPLFIFEGTGGTTDDIAKILHFQDAILDAELEGTEEWYSLEVPSALSHLPLKEYKEVLKVGFLFAMLLPPALIANCLNSFTGPQQYPKTKRGKQASPDFRQNSEASS